MVLLIFEEEEGTGHDAGLSENSFCAIGVLPFRHFQGVKISYECRLIESPIYFLWNLEFGM